MKRECPFCGGCVWIEGSTRTLGCNSVCDRLQEIASLPYGTKTGTIQSFSFDGTDTVCALCKRECKDLWLSDTNSNDYCSAKCLDISKRKILVDDLFRDGKHLVNIWHSDPTSIPNGISKCSCCGSKLTMWGLIPCGKAIQIVCSLECARARLKDMAFSALLEMMSSQTCCDCSVVSPGMVWKVFAAIPNGKPFRLTFAIDGCPKCAGAVFEKASRLLNDGSFEVTPVWGLPDDYRQTEKTCDECGLVANQSITLMVFSSSTSKSTATVCGLECATVQMSKALGCASFQNYISKFPKPDELMCMPEYLDLIGLTSKLSDTAHQDLQSRFVQIRETMLKPEETRPVKVWNNLLHPALYKKQDCASICKSIIKAYIADFLKEDHQDCLMCKVPADDPHENISVIDWLTNLTQKVHYILSSTANPPSQ